jgi:hypothetical protein
MKRDHKKQFRNALDNLPQYSPDQKVWDRIERQLGFQEQLTIACRNLPVYEPGENIWQKIENKLDDKKTIHLFPQILRYMSIAAGIAVIVTLSLTITKRNKEILTKSVEIAEFDSQVKQIETDKLSDEAISFIESQCKNSTYICEVPEFHQKQQQLTEVTGELKKVDKEMESLGSSPSLFQTKTKLENLKAQLIKDLVKKVTS